MKLFSGCITDKGRYRQNNEDAVLIRSLQNNDKDLLVGVVCDGIGSLDGGELASEYIVKKVNAWFNTITNQIDLERVDGQKLYLNMQTAAESWNLDLIKYMRDENLQMGTTMSLVMIVNSHIYGMHVGDSRVYRFNRQGLSQCTVDTSISKYINGKMQNFLESYIGKSEKLWFQLWESQLEVGDMILICSDGFYHNLKDDDIAEMYRNVCRKMDVTLCCRHAVDSMIARGERDNVTLGMIYVGQNKKKQLFPIFFNDKNKTS